MEDQTELIEKVLKTNSQDIEFEPIPEENDSPLAEPVVQKNSVSKTDPVKNPVAPENQVPDENTGQRKNDAETFHDAPEQEIREGIPEDTETSKPENKAEEFSMPLEHAQLMADSLIGTFNNTVLEVGGGYFVTVRKHKEFYDFEEIIQVIDEQNTRNIRRLKLDEEDKLLLRPLLVQILRKKAAAMSPEKQLVMVAFSILIKKTKVVMEIRSENDMLVERIRDVIRKEVRAAKEEADDTKINADMEDQQPAPEKQVFQQRREETNPDEGDETAQTERYQNKTGLPDEVVEHFD